MNDTFAPSESAKEADLIRIIIPGQPAGKGSIRSRAVNTRSGKSFIAHHTDKDTSNRMAFIRSQAVAAMAGRSPIEGAVEMRSVLMFRVPDSWSAKKRAAALAGEILPTVKPDLSNFLKLAEDGMNEVVFVDDKNICRSSVSKHYSATPCAIIEVRPIR